MFPIPYSILIPVFKILDNLSTEYFLSKCESLSTEMLLSNGDFFKTQISLSEVVINRRVFYCCCQRVAGRKGLRVRAQSYRPRTVPKASDGDASVKTRKLLLASVLPNELFYLAK